MTVLIENVYSFHHHTTIREITCDTDTNESNSEILVDGDFESGSFQHWQMTCSDENCGGTGSSLDGSNCLTRSYCYKGSCRNNYDFLQQSFHVIYRHVYVLHFWIKTTGNPDPNGYIGNRQD